MVTTGVTGGTWRAGVSAGGDVVPADGSAALAWHVAADDRWHHPATDAGVRQHRVDGTAVVETRLRVPGGAAVQRVWSVADHGGVTLVEVRNDSPLPIACAFTRGDLLTARPASGEPIDGAVLPAGSVVLPVGHRSRVVVGLAHAAPAAGPLPAGLPDSDAVARGWRARTDAASRLDLPDATDVAAVRAARCELLLGGLIPPAADPARYLLGVGELVRLGELDRRGAGELALEVAGAVAALAGRDRGWAGAALAAAGVVLAHAGERRALADLARIPPPVATAAAGSGDGDTAAGSGDGDTAAGSGDGDTAAGSGDGDIAAVAAVEGRLASGTRLLPGGMPATWRGRDLEAHGLVAGPRSRLALALRWHGRNVAVLWEVTGDPVVLDTYVTGSRWSSAEPRGETLWVLPP